MAHTFDSPGDAHRDAVLKIAELLTDARATDTVALDVSSMSGFADYFVIATATSQGHQRGLIVQLDELFAKLDVQPIHPRRRGSELGWVLIDLGFAVIHLMSAELRDFYELERLWFGAETVYGSFDSADS
jgi:ribosome-associated protein